MLWYPVYERPQRAVGAVQELKHIKDKFDNLQTVAEAKHLDAMNTMNLKLVELERKLRFETDSMFAPLRAEFKYPVEKGEFAADGFCVNFRKTW